MKSPSYFVFGLAFTSALLSGCAVINSHSETKTYGTHVSQVTLDQVEVGRTTEDWVVATLGHPASESDIGGAVAQIYFAPTHQNQFGAPFCARYEFAQGS